MLFAHLVKCSSDLLHTFQVHYWRQKEARCRICRKFEQVTSSILANLELKRNSRQKATEAFFVIEYESNLRVKALLR